MKPDWWNVSFILLIATGFQWKVVCLAAKLERKQDFFEVESFDNKREYGLSEIGKRGFSTLGFDYSSSTPEYGVGATNVVGSDYSNVMRSAGVGIADDEVTSASLARDLIPPPPPSGIFSSSSPPTSRSEYPKFGRISSSTSTKGFLSSHLHHHHHHSQHHHPQQHQHHHRSQISRRSPHLYHHYHLHHHPHQPSSSLSHYYDDPGGSSSVGGSTTSGGNRGERSGTNPVNFGLVADNDGKLIGYRGSILPGYADTQSIVSTISSSPSSGINPDETNFIGGYFPGLNSHPGYGKSSKFSRLASSASSGSYTSTPVYYPGREEDHTYRMRDTTSQGYDDGEEQSPSLAEDNDFTVGGSGTYQPSPLPQPPPLPPHHYHLREQNDGILGHNNILETSRFLPYGRDYAPTTSNTPTGFSYGPLGKNHRFPFDYNKRGGGGGSFNSVVVSSSASNAPSGYDGAEQGPPPHSLPYPYNSNLGYNEYGDG